MLEALDEGHKETVRGGRRRLAAPDLQSPAAVGSRPVSSSCRVETRWRH
jgi:hypothetical protein